MNLSTFIDFKFIPKFKETLSFSWEAEIDFISDILSQFINVTFSDLWLLTLLLSAFLTASTCEFFIQDTPDFL